MAPAKLELSEVAKNFMGIKAVESVSFTVEPGKVTGLIGPNGSGKTTTMNIITGLYSADNGRVLLDGVDITARRPNEIAGLGVARTFQNIRLLGELSTIENVMLGAHRHQTANLVEALLRLPRLRRSESEALSRCNELLEMVQISHLRDLTVSNLSYGDRRRVEIARALATQPRLLLLDEPAAGMNFAEKRALSDLVESIAASGVSILLIEHDIDFVARSSQHIVVLNFGREIAEGTPDSVRNMPHVIEAYLGSDDA